jgi:hypothetical protein
MRSVTLALLLALLIALLLVPPALAIPGDESDPPGPSALEVQVYSPEDGHKLVGVGIDWDGDGYYDFTRGEFNQPGDDALLHDTAQSIIRKIGG